MKMKVFFCYDCKVPPTFPWSCTTAVNTCPFDNIITAVALFADRNEEFLNKLGKSSLESAIFGGVTYALEGKYEGIFYKGLHNFLSLSWPRPQDVATDKFESFISIIA